MVGMATVIYGFLWFWYARENRKREGGIMKEGQTNLSEEELAELGDQSYRYRYTI